jgi:two-component system response regulator YesN
MTGYLKEHLSEEITLKVLADEFHLSPNYVGQVFSDRIGVNYQAYLMNLRMEEAKSLLLTTQKPIAEISELVGYKDYRVFTRTFKRLEKVTPTSFRKTT